MFRISPFLVFVTVPARFYSPPILCLQPSRPVSIVFMALSSRICSRPILYLSLAHSVFITIPFRIFDPPVLHLLPLLVFVATQTHIYSAPVLQL